MGVTQGAKCKNGNSADIDGRNFFSGHDFEGSELLNYVDWETEDGNGR